ncbi:hypothetical protein [Lolliginicoccus levis]|nr:hypothetical protein [Lolliginicoccus levis]
MPAQHNTTPGPSEYSWGAGLAPPATPRQGWLCPPVANPFPPNPDEVT